MPSSRLAAFLLLAAANLFWSGNWVAGRALRDAFDPITLNFWRWVVATATLAPFALPRMRGKWGEVRRHAGILLALAFTGVSLFQTLVYLGLSRTPTINAVLLNSTDANIHAIAKTEIMLNSGKSTLLLKEDGTIELVGVKIFINGKELVQVDAPKIGIHGKQETLIGVGAQSVLCDTAQVAVSGAEITAAAQGTHNVKGALVKIN